MTDRRHLGLDEYLPYLINRVGSALVFSFTQGTLQRQRLSIAAWRVLAVLSNNGQQRQIDVAEMTSIEASTLSRLIARMVRTGLVIRKRSKTNNREVAIQLTTKGRALVDRLIPVARALEKVAIGDLPERDLAVAKRSLRQMYENVARGRLGK